MQKILTLGLMLVYIVVDVHAAESKGEAGALRAETPLTKAPSPVMAIKVDNAGKTAEEQGKSPEIKREKGWSFKLRGRLMYDVANVSPPAALDNGGLGFSSELRRARLGVQGTIPGGLGYKFEVDVASGDVVLTDALLNYRNKGLTITIGQHNGFQSLEELSSSNDISFIERSAFTDAFGFERRVGISGQIISKQLLVQAGLFSANVDDLSSDGNSNFGFDGRLVFMPKIGKIQLHLGGSYHWRDLKNAPAILRYRQRPLVHPTDTRFIDTGNIAADSEQSYGLEAAAIFGRFHAAAETHWLSVNAAGPGTQGPTFFGGSLEAGVFLTNDKRGYKNGIFKGVKVKNPVGSGGIGAFQFNLRYDHLDLNDGIISGGGQNGYMASLIWMPADHVRFMINYAKLFYTDAAIAAGAARDYSVNVVGARARISF